MAKRRLLGQFKKKPRQAMYHRICCSSVHAVLRGGVQAATVQAYPMKIFARLAPSALDREQRSIIAFAARLTSTYGTFSLWV